MKYLIWLWIGDILQNLGGITAVLGCVGVFVGAAGWFFMLADQQYGYYVKGFKRLFFIGLGLSVLWGVLPTRNTILIGVGLSITEDAINTELGQKALDALNVRLDEIIDETTYD